MLTYISLYLFLCQYLYLILCQYLNICIYIYICTYFHIYVYTHICIAPKHTILQHEFSVGKVTIAQAITMLRNFLYKKDTILGGKKMSQQKHKTEAYPSWN